MGIHAYIKELNPIALYTFDPRDSFLDIDRCTGFYINVTEIEFPPLELKNSGIYIKEPFLKFTTPALSYIETNSLKKSFSTADGSTIYGSYPSIGNTNANYSFKNGSLYAECDLSDNIDFVDSSYTIFLQMKISSLVNMVTNNQPYLLYAEYLEPVSHVGLFSRCEFYNGKLFDEDIIFGIGYSSYVLEYDGEFKLDNAFGYFATSNISYNPGNIYGDVIFNKPSSIFYEKTYNSSEMLNLYFKFRGIELNILPGGYILIDGSNSTYVGLDKIINVFIEYDHLSNKALLYIDKSDGQYITIDHPYTNNLLKIGYESKLRRVSVANYESLNTNIADTPRLNVSFDNLAIYPRKLNQVERDRLFDINRDYASRFAEYGYNQLYTFDSMYDSVSRKYIENGTSVQNVNGLNSYLTIRSCNIYNMPYVYRQNDVEIEYVYHNTKDSSISTNRAYSTNTPVSLIRSDTKTVSFRFNTSDLNGVLFVAGLYENNSSNIGLIMNEGSLQVWMESELKTSITGMSNAEWHSIYIVFNSNNTRIYVDENLYFTSSSALKPSSDGMAFFGSSMPGNSLECDYALIGVSTIAMSLRQISTLKQNTTLYSVMGQITINNVPIGTKIYVYDRSTGILIDTIISSALDGTFKYINKTPYVLTIIVSDSGYLNGRAYIVDPVEIK